MSLSSQSNSLVIFPAICFVLIVTNLNEAFKDFFLDGFVLFVIATLSFYSSHKNIALAMAEGFLLTILVKIITIQDPISGMTQGYERFKLLFPSTDSKVSCNKMTKAELLKFFDDDTNQLQHAMEIGGVPSNIGITNESAPVIGTYLNLC
jgi:hypothetical protein